MPPLREWSRFSTQLRHRGPCSIKAVPRVAVGLALALASPAGAQQFDPVPLQVIADVEMSVHLPTLVSLGCSPKQPTGMLTSVSAKSARFLPFLLAPA